MSSSSSRFDIFIIIFSVVIVVLLIGLGINSSIPYDAVVVSVNNSTALIEPGGVVLNPFPELKIGDKVQVTDGGYSEDSIKRIYK